MDETRNPKIPRLILEADIESLPLGPTEGFVWSRIDGTASVDEIADMTGLPPEQVVRVVEQLIEFDVAEWVEPIHPRTRSSSAARPTPTRGTLRTKPPPPNTSELLYDPQELEEPNVDLDLDRRREILDTFYRLDELSLYGLLNVPEDCDKKDIRDAYFALSKKFHPDTLYGKRLGSYKLKMEAVFKRLSEAYEVLGKKRTRAEYDAYLKLRERTMAAQKSLEEGRRAAERVEREVQRVPGRMVVDPASRSAPAAPPEPERKPPAEPEQPSRPMSAEAKNRSRRWLAKKLAAATGRGLPGTPSPSEPPARPATPPPQRPEPAGPTDRDVLLRGLASSLKQAAALTGGFERAERHLEEARRAERDGNLVAACNALRLAMVLAPEREDIAESYRRVHQRLARSLAETYEKQAQYEEQAGRWAEAALSWRKVCEGRPDDAHAHRRAAVALLEAGGDLAQARTHAQRAVDLLPEDSRTRRALGRVLFAAGMTLNAKRELEKAAKLDPSDEMVKNLLRELGKKR